MSNNPYEAPRHDPDPVRSPSSGGSGPQDWTVGQALQVGWEAFKKHWAVLVGSLLLAGVIFGVTQYVAASATGVSLLETNPAAVRTRTIASMIASLLVTPWMMIGMWRVWLAAARGEEPTMVQFFSGADRYVPVLGLQALLTLVPFGIGQLLGDSPMLQAIPSIVIGLALPFAVPYVSDAGLPPLQAIEVSWKAAEGQRLSLLGALLACGFVASAGVIACIVGALVTAPMAFVAIAFVYTRLSGRGAVAVAEPVR